MFGEIKEQLDRIEVQTKKTNGSVISLRMWRSGIVMSMSVFAFIVLPLVIYIYTNQVQAFTQQIAEIKK